MKMKRSEYVFNLRRDGLTEAQANRAAREAEEAGVEWAPEEVRVAKRIYIGTTLDGGERRGLWTHDADMAPRNLTATEEREAAARYNAVENILTHDEGTIHVDHVGRVLRRERERLLPEESK